MSSRMFQSVILQMKDATDKCIGVVDYEGSVIACSELQLIGTKLDDFRVDYGDSAEKLFTSNERTFRLLSGGAKFDYAVFTQGTDQSSKCICIMAAVAFSEARNHYEEKYNKAAFVKNIISDNILPGDVYVRAKELRFAAELPRAVLCIRQTERFDLAAIDTLTRLFPDVQRDFIINVTESDIAIVKELLPNVDNSELYELASTVQETLKADLGIQTVIGIGSTAHHLRELADRYKEAQTAIDVGHVFEPEKTIINYDNLGIGRIIYHLPTTLCEMFLSEVFKKNPIESLDSETLYTINKFFDNNLNVSETSRKLFVHRNTLVYRLDKIRKLTGLDLREFDHAIVFKVALMVKKYLNSQQK